MIKKIFKKFYKKNMEPNFGFPVGKVIHVESPHHPYTVLIVDRRYSDLMGFEYRTLVDGKMHEWLSHSVVEKIIETSAKYSRL